MTVGPRDPLLPEEVNRSINNSFKIDVEASCLAACGQPVVVITTPGTKRMMTATLNTTDCGVAGEGSGFVDVCTVLCV